MRKIYAKDGQMIDLGKRGENLALCVWFDIKGWDRIYGPGEVHLLHQRNGDVAPYPCVVEVLDTFVLWTITETDRAVPGIGRAELQYVVGNTVVKSDVYVTRSEKGLGNAGAVPEAPETGWVERVLQAAEAAEEAASRAQVDVSGVKDYVDERLEGLQVSASTARIGSVFLRASAWVSNGSLHSQVVNIDGVSRHSQVDLTPSVEQLVIFYEKDLTFVTENDGGVVTVYAIGQKPTNDYTIQVTITEVSL